MLLISFLREEETSITTEEERNLSESKLFIQTDDLHYEGEGEEGTNPMELSREFTERFSEIFLEDSMADFLDLKEDSL